MKKAKVTAKSVHRHTIAIPMQKELLELRKLVKDGSLHFELAVSFGIPRGVIDARDIKSAKREISQAGGLSFTTERRAKDAASNYSCLDGVKSVRITKHYVSHVGLYQSGRKL